MTATYSQKLAHVRKNAYLTKRFSSNEDASSYIHSMHRQASFERTMGVRKTRYTSSVRIVRNQYEVTFVVNSAKKAKVTKAA